MEIVALALHDLADRAAFQDGMLARHCRTGSLQMLMAFLPGMRILGGFSLA
ncbi:hypothetical protein RX327_31535 [Bradyrhizobium sp. BEA-2-5]|uniref:hypothetical protein n=1 Tax=Bradyrhizobium sp. BEA-2-5 TaxID=3080015 RepID=UPI00293EA902|nr:hypothetical protein [Bradyrhizobium sp. BEA-2-5]WOH80307.1 hypothetical protein RX327_31535 [Bradyrhizobium sp. BEA-2-5]